MKKWTKFLTVPVVMLTLAGCSSGAAEGEDTSGNREEQATEQQSSSEETSNESSSSSDETSGATEGEENSGEEADASSSATGSGDSDASPIQANSDGGPGPEEAAEIEDLNAGSEAAAGTTIDEVEMEAEDWVEQASEATDAVEGDTYVQLDRGVLTVDQLNAFLNSMPVELTYADDNNQFLYYNYHAEAEDMLGARTPDQVGNPLANCHPEEAYQNVSWVVNQLRNNHTDHVRIAVPSGGEDQFVVHDYYGMYDEEGNYMGINEVIHDIMPEVEFYLEQTGQKLTGDEESSSESSGSSSEESSSDAESGATS